MTKIDTPDADIEKVKGDLSAIGLVPEDWGGDTQMIPVSAKNGDGMNDLLKNNKHLYRSLIFLTVVLT